MFVDYTKAFDMVSHPKLFKVLLEIGIPKHLVALVQALYAQQTTKVRWDGESSEAFTIGKSTRQGCNISPVEFNLYVKDIMRRTLENNEHGIKVGGRQINNLRYADDTTLLTTTDESINDMAAKLVNESKTSNMLFNAKKTKIIVAGRQNTRVNLQIDGKQIEQVKQFKFLGSMKTASDDCTTEVRRRICLAKEKAVKLDTIWRSRHIKKALKVRLIKSLVWSVFLYGAESWTIKKVTGVK